MDEVLTRLEAAVKTATGESLKPKLSVPEEQFGDLSTNVAMQLSKKVGQNPRALAEQIIAALHGDDMIAESTIAGPGFINIRLTDRALWQAAQTQPNKVFADKRILLEYSCPNAFKELHTGHLYNTILGDTIARLVEKAGATVFRTTFGGDVGLHVARCIWGIQKMLEQGDPASLDDVPVASRAQWISQAYVLGAKADTEDEAAQKAIRQINQQVYDFHAHDDHDSELAQIYWRCREWSYDYFKDFYKQLNVAPFDKYYPESQTTDAGVGFVKEHTGNVFQESDGAIVFRGEDHGLHTRVFMTSAGLPTYETKDIGVILTEVEDFTYDQRILLTGNDQVAYMQVVWAALGQVEAELAAKQRHITNGMVTFGDGNKMSSRSGNVTRAVEVIDTVSSAVEADDPATRQDITLGAVKYTFLKQRIGGDIAFDVDESVSLQGNSGPYLQYAHARARSILAKSDGRAAAIADLQPGERSLVRKLGEYSRVVEQATLEFEPHLICTYLYELCQVFNRFYEQHRVIGDPREAQRLTLVGHYADTLRHGLDLLNIATPEKM